jgi:hypothetical protein
MDLSLKSPVWMNPDLNLTRAWGNVKGNFDTNIVPFETANLGSRLSVGGRGMIIFGFPSRRRPFETARNG